MRSCLWKNKSKEEQFCLTFNGILVESKKQFLFFCNYHHHNSVAKQHFYDDCMKTYVRNFTNVSHDQKLQSIIVIMSKI